MVIPFKKLIRLSKKTKKQWQFTLWTFVSHPLAAQWKMIYGISVFTNDTSVNEPKGISLVAHWLVRPWLSCPLNTLHFCSYLFFLSLYFTEKKKECCDVTYDITKERQTSIVCYVLWYNSSAAFAPSHIINNIRAWWITRKDQNRKMGWLMTA